MPSHPFQHVPILLLLILLVFLLLLPPSPVQAQQTPSAESLKTFLSCLPSSIPRHVPATSTYKTLISRSFYTPSSNSTYQIPPQVIVPVANEAQIAKTLECAKASDLGVCARSGGHSLVGKSTCNGILVDVGLINHVKLLDDDIADIGSGVNNGKLLWELHEQGKKWAPAGVCPPVGVGGYVFGGGHGPYEALHGMACDNLVEVRLVTYGGEVLVVRKGKGDWKERELFWGLCGGGGGQFGIVSSFKMKVFDSLAFDKSVAFRFNWKLENVGVLMNKWMDYDQDDGSVWFRMEISLERSGPDGKESGMFGFGACWNCDSIDECMKRLQKGEFFNTPGRSLVYIGKMRNALDAHAFFGPAGGWGRKKPGEDLKSAFLGQEYTDAGTANGRTYKSFFLKKKGASGKLDPPSPEFWQKHANFISNPGRQGIPWFLCELNLFNNAIDTPVDNAFAHRDADVIVHCIVGGGSNETRKFIYNWLKNHFAPYNSGVYVNYPELELGETYPQAYWGKNLQRLGFLKQRMDPDVKILNSQPIPPSSKLASDFYARWKSVFGWSGAWPFEF